ncbi:MAG TPA: nucleotidyltransferase domain-containing protein [Thermoplasmata archaeon]|nr:nucleotidyltransferase domain-containing protein [Thermoplasmata archaeon]
MALSTRDGRRRGMARPKRRLKTLEEILTVLRSSLPELRAKHHIRTLAVFGSYVRGDRRARSDLDLLVDFEKSPGLIEFIRIEEEIGRLVGIRVDLISRGALRPDRDATRNILQEAVAV